VKSSHLLLIVASLVVLAAVTYMFTAAESPEDYQEKIETSGSANSNTSDSMLNLP